MISITQADVEHAALDWLIALGWQVAHGPDIAPGGQDHKKHSYQQDYEP